MVGRADDPFWGLIELDPDVIDPDPEEKVTPQQLPGNCIIPALHPSRSVLPFQVELTLVLVA